MISTCIALVTTWSYAASWVMKLRIASGWEARTSSSSYFSGSRTGRLRCLKCRTKAVRPLVVPREIGMTRDETRPPGRRRTHGRTAQDLRCSADIGPRRFMYLGGGVELELVAGQAGAEHDRVRLDEPPDGPDADQVPAGGEGDAVGEDYLIRRVGVVAQQERAQPVAVVAGERPGPPDQRDLLVRGPRRVVREAAGGAQGRPLLGSRDTHALQLVAGLLELRQVPVETRAQDLVENRLAVLGLRQSGSAGPVGEDGMMTPVAPLLSTAAMTRRRHFGGSCARTFFPVLMTRRRAPAEVRLLARAVTEGASEVCCTTLSLNSATFPLEPKAKKAEREVCGPPLPTTQEDGIICNVSSAALARQPSSKKKSSVASSATGSRTRLRRRSSGAPGWC